MYLEHREHRDYHHTMLFFSNLPKELLLDISYHPTTSKIYSLVLVSPLPSSSTPVCHILELGYGGFWM
jgi:hypothetical protein